MWTGGVVLVEVEVWCLGLRDFVLVIIRATAGHSVSTSK